MKKYRQQQRSIIYTDETWLNEGHVRNKIWVDTKVKSSHQAKMEGLSTGLKNPKGKGMKLKRKLLLA